MRSDSTEDRLADWFRTGVEPADVTALHPLNQARPAIAALIALFNGTEAAVLIRLLVLREVAARGGEPFFEAAELRSQFPYLDEAKLDHLIGRLRIHGLLAWDSETARYSVSPLGRMVIAALSSLLRFGDDGAELGYLAAQLAGSDAIGSVSGTELSHLRARLVELKDEFERAILSGSERRIRAAERKLEAVWTWVDKSSDILRRIVEESELDGPAHREAQQIGRLQSELLRMGGAFQRALNRLESQKVHLGASGLSSADVSAWLRGLDQSRIVALAAGAVAPVPDFAFVLGDIALDVTEFELVDKLRPDKLDLRLPPSSEAPATEGAELAAPDFAELESWLAALSAAPDGWRLSEGVPLRDYELSSYRLSLLALLGDRESAVIDGPVADVARLPRLPEWSGVLTQVDREGVAEMSEGYLRDSGGKAG
jgi:hypothetical protein